MQNNLIESLLATPQLYGVKVSPDRKWVVWMWGNVGPNTDVYIAPLDRIEAPRKFTDFKQRTRAVSWSSDSKSIIASHDYDGDERAVLYKIDIATGESIRLTDEHPSYFIRGGTLDPTEKYLIYGANFDFDTQKEIEATLVYHHDLSTGEKKRLSHHQKPCYLNPKMNRAGTHIIYEKNDLDPEGEQVWMVDIEGNEEKEILNFGDNVKVFASWHSNSEDIIFIVELKEYRKVGIYNRLSADIRWIIDDPARNIESAHMPFGATSILISETHGAVDRFYLVDSETLEETPFPNDLNIQLVYAQISDNVWISKAHSSTQPGDLIIHNINTPTIVRKVTDVFEKVSYTRDDLCQAENYTWKAEDGMVIQGWLYKTKQEPKGTILMVHGGPTSHSEDTFDVDIQYFVSQGFNVLDPNYRGSTGFGVPFQEAIKKDGWGGAEQTDILAGIKSLIQDGIAEPYKVGITGTSYGGYSSWHAIVHFDPEYVAASAPVCGMTDLFVDYETTRPDLRGYTEEMMGGSPSVCSDKYYTASPINFVQNIKGDLLIVQGAKDPNVTLENVRTIEEKLNEHGIKYEKLIFDDEGHGISKPKNLGVMLKRMVEFFEMAFEKPKVQK